MKRTCIVLFTIIIALVSGCNDRQVENPLPEFNSVEGPTGEFGYLDHVSSTAEVNLKGWTNTDVYFRFATSAEAVKTVDATELTDLCTGTGPIRNCTAVLPNAWSEQRLIFPTGTTVFYQWFIDYKLPQGTDVATIEGQLGSYSVVVPQSCVVGSDRSNEQCPAGQSCVRDFIRADPDTTLAPTVCRIPGP